VSLAFVVLPFLAGLVLGWRVRLRTAAFAGAILVVLIWLPALLAGGLLEGLGLLLAVAALVLAPWIAGAAIGRWAAPVVRAWAERP
jgi:hypothetical protein